MTHFICRTVQDYQSLDPKTSSNWVFYLPGDASMILSRLEHDLCLLRFFKYFSSWQLCVIPHLFLRDLALVSHRGWGLESGPNQPLNHYSGVLHNAILAVALSFSDNPHLRSRETRDRFAKHAKLFLEAEFQAPTLGTVQGLALLSSFHSGLSEQGESCIIGPLNRSLKLTALNPGLGFMYFGILEAAWS